MWQVRVPAPPVNRYTAVHFVSSIAVSQDVIRKWLGFGVGILVAAYSLELDVTFSNCRKKIREQYQGSVRNYWRGGGRATIYVGRVIIFSNKVLGGSLFFLPKLRGGGIIFLKQSQLILTDQSVLVTIFQLTGPSA